MGLLRPVKSDVRTALSRIIASKKGKRRQRLRVLEPRILRRYSQYDTHAENLSELSSSDFNAQERADCEHCYDNDTEPLSKVKKAIAAGLPEHGQFYCVLCYIGKWDTFDHFVPKSRFPEFAVLSYNLVPCCAKCNQLKGHIWDAHSRPAVMNLYYDAWPRKRYLFAEIDFDAERGVLVRYSLLDALRLGRISRGRLVTHHNQLDLLARFTEAAGSAVTWYRYALARHAENKPGRRQVLNREAQALRDLYGPNHWKTVLVEALAESDEFLDSVD